ncbi:hypothetical protein P7D86_21390 [Enterococcus avium]|uniref:hypothetical protein n=1 Tax=Enterococcus avium TaxID=33945 RepID=UPI002890CE95|nr:hypothetical protein [Enterococcus avium]MDT2429363.1 hypothetical protein [Enterococcus avium]
MYRPQYLEQRYEETYIYAGSDSKPYLTIRKPIKSDTYKRKENNEVIRRYGRKIHRRKD